ncbi:Protein FAM169B [Camelus dromedarius]|uniref:Protein FAM169B n=1 Tax=Camelus dromedarius TaxID=9838 RepID=A0A5N4CF97_CAMDR|nr:Protein FAM169B [Camelus dromedarius]
MFLKPTLLPGGTRDPAQREGPGRLVKPREQRVSLAFPAGGLCGDGTGACYLLPVFDTVFVRKRYRHQGLGLAMLWDFCETFREVEALGVSWPISTAMYQVCRKFLAAHPEERGRLWEVGALGAWGQRGSIWLKVQLQQSRDPDLATVIFCNPGWRGSVAKNWRRMIKIAQGNELRGRSGEPAGLSCRTEGKRRAADAGLPGGSWRKHTPPSPRLPGAHLI